MRNKVQYYSVLIFSMIFSISISAQHDKHDAPKKAEVSMQYHVKIVHDDKHEVPDAHGGYLIIGSETVYYCHIPMFSNPNHQYQVIAEFDLGKEVHEKVGKFYKSNPEGPYFLANLSQWSKVGDENRVLADMFLNAEGKYVEEAQKKIRYDIFYKDFPWMENMVHLVSDGSFMKGDKAMNAPSQATLKRLIVFHHYTLDPNAMYPPNMTYYLFGDEKEAYISHYVLKGPSFQHVAKLAELPKGVSVEALKKGVLITFPGLEMSENPEKYIDKEPLTASTYKVVIQGKSGLHEITIDKSLWFIHSKQLETH